MSEELRSIATLREMERGLTLKQRKFAQAYVIDSSNLTQLCRDININRRSAYNYLANPKVIDYMEEYGKGLSKDILSKEQLLTFLSEVIVNGELTEDHVIPSGKVVKKGVGMKDKLQSATLLGKAMGLYIERNVNESKIEVVEAGSREVIEVEDLEWLEEEGRGGGASNE